MEIQSRSRLNKIRWKMLFQYTYVKQRQQFGKQCIFMHNYNVAEEHIWPDRDLMQDYVLQPQCHQYAHNIAQFAAHEAQTPTKTVKNTGVLHLEGGWPKEINAWEEDAMYRFRRRVRKDDNYILSMKSLVPLMESHIYQNNAVNIYENFFDDMIPTHLVVDYNIRIRSEYEDPQANVRPIRHLTWSPHDSNRLAAAYSFAEFVEHATDVNTYSYVWDIGTRISLMLFDDEPRLIDVPCHGTSKHPVDFIP